MDPTVYEIRKLWHLYIEGKISECEMQRRLAEIKNRQPELELVG